MRVNDTNLPRLVARDSTNSRPDVQYTDLHSGLWFTKRSQRTSFSANGTSAVQYYPRLSNAVRWSGAAAAGLTKTGQRFRFGFDQQTAIQPVRTLPRDSDSGRCVDEPGKRVGTRRRSGGLRPRILSLQLRD